MDINIVYDPETYTVRIDVDGARLKAQKETTGQIKFSASFDEIEDDNIHSALQKFCKIILQEGEEI